MVLCVCLARSVLVDYVLLDMPARKTYEIRVYEQLADLYIKQEWSKDAADTFNSSRARTRWTSTRR